MNPQRRRTVFAAAVGLLAAWAILLAVVAVQRGESTSGTAGAGAPVAEVASAEGPFRAGPLPEGLAGKPAHDFALTDARGKRVDTRTLRGRPYVVTFLYTDCPDVCPLIASELDAALERLGPRGDEVEVVAVSADPKGDTRMDVLRWLEERELPDNFRYVIGTEDQLRPVWDGFYAAPQDRDREQSAHSASIWLVDAEGRLRAKFSGGLPVPPPDIAHDLGVLLEEAA
ncbi:MAG TPA: SCO family protein [Solirubrobacteraceae bacterium]|nr:SCO family protein [Solirubrobacteraceae bacterium]